MRRHLLLTIALMYAVLQGAWAQDCSAGTEDELCCRAENKAPRLYKDGYWNTLCLPFDITTFAGTPIDGAKLIATPLTKKLGILEIHPILYQ